MNRESVREQQTKRRVLMCVVGEWKGGDILLNIYMVIF
tara:strand:+ start:591 stop:704 length:114 start_codon:yes stop_codon:yes gene_type:complete